MDNIFELPEDVLWLIALIEKNGFRAYIVGGCVRDIIMGRVPHDYDMTTDASPEDMIKIFQKESLKMILNGLKHGTVGVCIHGEVYEVTTFRIDGEYEDHRRPESVTFTRNIYEDLKRRDFTINAMAYNPIKGLIDICGGKDDIKGKIIRTVGNPYDRFSEDALRIMRAFRFSAQLGFSIEENTLKAAEKLGESIEHIAIERVQEEFNKIILSDVTKILELHEYGILKRIIGDLQIASANSEFIHVVKCTSSLENKLSVRLAMLLYSMDVKNVEKLLKNFRYSNTIIKDVLQRIEGMNRNVSDKLSLKELMRDYNLDVTQDVLKMKAIECMFSDEHKDYGKIQVLQKIYNDIIKNEECYSKKQLAITGEDIGKMGAQGSVIGELMKYILGEVIKDNFLNEHDKLISMAQQYLKKNKSLGD